MSHDARVIVLCVLNFGAEYQELANKFAGVLSWISPVIPFSMMAVGMAVVAIKKRYSVQNFYRITDIIGSGLWRCQRWTAEHHTMSGQ